MSASLTSGVGPGLRRGGEFFSDTLPAFNHG